MRRDNSHQPGHSVLIHELLKDVVTNHPITLLQPIGQAGFLITAPSQLIDVVADLPANQITKLLGILELAGNHILEVANVQERMRFF